MECPIQYFGRGWKAQHFTTPDTTKISQTPLIIVYIFSKEELKLPIVMITVITILFYKCTDGSKFIRALAIILAIFLWFDCQFLLPHACYKQYKA